MSATIKDIKEQLGKFAGQYGPATILPATVVAINDDDTCKIVFSNDTTIDDCRLKSVVKAGNKVLLVPKNNTVIQVARIENSNEWVVFAVDEVVEIIEIIDGVKYSMNNAGFLIKNDDVTMQSLFTDLLDAILAEKHLTNYGPTISLTPNSELKFNDLKTKVNKLFRNA